MTTSNYPINKTFTPTVARTQLAAVFPDRAQARLVLNDLRAFGLRLDQIGVAMRDAGQQDRLVADTGLHASAGAIGAPALRPQGGLRGWLGGIRSTLLPNHPALTPDGARAVGLVLPGGIIGALMHMHMSEARARSQEAGYRSGSVLVTASVFEDVAEAQAILQRHGGGVVHWGEHVPVI